MDSPSEDVAAEAHVFRYTGMPIPAILVALHVLASCSPRAPQSAPTPLNQGSTSALAQKKEALNNETLLPDAPATSGPTWRPNYSRPAVIDIHTHLSPAALTRIRSVMKDNGIESWVNLSGGTIRRGVQGSVELQERVTGMFHFLNIDWGLRAHPEFGQIMAKSLDYAVSELGFKGLKVSKALGLYVRDKAGKRLEVDTPLLDPLWEMAGRLKVPVAIHTGDPKAFWEPVDHHNERYDELVLHPRWSFAGDEHPSRETLLAERDRLLERHRGTTFICVHFGNNPEDLDYVEGLLKRHPNVVLDTSARLGEIGRHPAERVRSFFITYAERIVFGTDLGLGSSSIMLGSTGKEEPTMADVKPFYDAHWRFFEGSERDIDHPTPIQGNWKIDAINLPEEVLYKLYRGNAERLLKLSPSADHRPDAGVGEELKE